MRAWIAGFVGLALLQVGSLQPARTQGTQPAGKPFRVAMVIGVTGPTGPQQQAIVDGLQAAANVLNAQGGILGRPIEVSVFDHQNDPARAVRILQEDVLTKSWDLLCPCGGSIVVAPMLPFVTKARILAFANLFSANPEKTTADFPTFFDLLPATADAAVAFAQHMKAIGAKKVALLYAPDLLGLGTSKAYGDAAKALGIDVVLETYDPAAVDVTPSLLKLKAQNPDHLFFTGLGTAAGHVLNSLDKLGWTVPLIGDLTVGGTNLPALAPPRAYAHLEVMAFGVYHYVAPGKRSPQMKLFLSALHQNGPITQNLLDYSWGWDTLMLTALAAQYSGSTDTMKMIDRLEHLNLTPRQRTYVTFSEYRFTPTNHVVPAGPSEYSFVPYTPFHEGMIGK